MVTQVGVFERASIARRYLGERRDEALDARDHLVVAAAAEFDDGAVVELDGAADANAAAKSAMARGGAKIAVPDRRLKRAAVPNDTFVTSQWYLTNDYASVSAYGAWNITTGSSSVAAPSAMTCPFRIR